MRLESTVGADITMVWTLSPFGVTYEIIYIYEDPQCQCCADVSPTARLTS